MTRLIIPKWLTLPTIPNSSAITDALTDYNSAMSETLAAGDPNPLWEFILQATVYGASLEAVGRQPLTLTRLTVDQDTLAFYASLVDIRRVVAGGGDLENYPMFFQFNAALLTSNVPATWPNRTYLDENEVEQVYTIQEWFNIDTFDQYPITFDGGTTYVIPNQNPRGQGAYLPASLWINQGGITLRTVDWYLARLPQE